MKRILSLTFVALLAFMTLFSLVSCEILDLINDFNGSNLNSDNVNNDTFQDSENIVNSDIIDSNSDSDIAIDCDGDSYSDNIGNDNTDDFCGTNGHTDSDKNDYCDKCGEYLIVVVDFYAINDLHGKFCDSSSQPGVDELGTYFENRKNEDDHIVLLSSGDMWQGSAESVLSYGKIMVDWMNELGFVAMTLGNHEFDWGEEIIKDNLQISDFPFLAINVYSNTTGERVEYCAPSIVIERGDLQIGIIGAIGDCYSSISSDMVTNVNFKVGDELTNLVKHEALKLRGSGVDLIVYSLHDGNINSFDHYDTALSNGYVDVVFEGHSHQTYIRNDSNGIIHIQGGGENDGLSHVEIAVNPVTGNKKVTEQNIITNSSYANLEDHAPTEAIEDKYSEIIDYAYSILGNVSLNHSSSEVADYVAKLYLEAGIEKWGAQYDVVLGGGFLQTRSPYDLSSGDVTYADILSLLPFNNRIVLCRASGSKLKSQFINTTNKSYHIALNDTFNASDVKETSTYFIVVDMYTALYKYNGLTIIDYYDQSTYARDLFAKAVKEGKLHIGDSEDTNKPELNNYTITPIQAAIQKGETLEIGEETTEYLYYKGTIDSFVNTTYGNCYITDEYGSQIYIYGLKDTNGNRYDAMLQKPQVGDEIIIFSVVKKYQYPSGDIVIELINSVVMAINP